MLDSLTRRERQVLVLLAQGRNHHEIGEMLGISPKTVDTFRGHILKKCSLRNNSDLTRFAIKRGVIDVDGVELPLAPSQEHHEQEPQP